MPAMLSRVIASQTETGGLRVLVVDDEQSITDAVATALRYEGFETREAATGRSAEKAIDDFRPDLVVLDVMLPDLDGFAIARRLRDGRHRTPVIFLTAKDANVVETYVSYLRKKLDSLGLPLIRTIRLVGYALREAEA